jgi:hypothetical protein
MVKIKAIETEYKGYRFRSRLEARWAVFFDRLGIEWQYEPEGFVLSDETRYLPDFYLPRLAFGTWAEVKCRFGDLSKAIQFARDGAQVWLCEGEPQARPYVLATEVGDIEGFPNVYREHAFATWLAASMFCPTDEDLEAVRAARSARFEFGESGG